MATRQPALFGIAGWKNAGKTTLTERLVAEFVRRGFSVATIKHAHHAFDIDREGTDSFRHRKAGARQVAIVSDRRFALIEEFGGDGEPALTDIVNRLQPADLVLIEGYKGAAHPKIEIRANGSGKSLAASDPQVRAIATDDPVPEGAQANLPVFARDAIAEMADFISHQTGLARP